MHLTFGESQCPLNDPRNAQDFARCPACGTGRWQACRFRKPVGVTPARVSPLPAQLTLRGRTQSRCREASAFSPPGPRAAAATARIPAPDGRPRGGQADSRVGARPWSASPRAACLGSQAARPLVVPPGTFAPDQLNADAGPRHQAPDLALDPGLAPGRDRRRVSATPARQITPPTRPHTVGISPSTSHEIRIVVPGTR